MASAPRRVSRIDAPASRGDLVPPERDRPKPISPDALAAARVLAESERTKLVRTFAAHVSELRQAAGLSQAQYAARCQLSVEVIEEIELARIEPVLTLPVLLSNGLGIAPKVLIGCLETSERRGE
jgi:ribosome-binding protein aMBF1 (putative translation factor)